MVFSSLCAEAWGVPEARRLLLPGWCSERINRITGRLYNTRSMRNCIGLRSICILLLTSHPLFVSETGKENPCSLFHKAEIIPLTIFMKAGFHPRKPKTMKSPVFKDFSCFVRLDSGCKQTGRPYWKTYSQNKKTNFHPDKESGAAGKGIRHVYRCKYNNKYNGRYGKCAAMRGGGQAFRPDRQMRFGADQRKRPEAECAGKAEEIFADWPAC